MDSSERTAPIKSVSPVIKTILKPIKTKLRYKKDEVRQCRLCMRVVPRADTHDTMSPGSDLRRKILDAVVVEIFAHDKVTSVCISCVMLVDIINNFRMACRKADTLHGTKLMMMHPGSWLSDENKSSLVSCHRIVKRNRAEMDALYRCSGVNNEEVHRVNHARKEEVVKNIQQVDLAVACQPNNDGNMKCNANEIDSDQKISDNFGIEQDAPLEEAERLAAKKEAKMYMCELCGKLMQKMYREEHENMHIGRRPYNCPEKNCNKTFGSSVLMSMHKSNVHRTRKRIECEICHKSIKGELFYQQHLQTHQATNSLKVPCNVCGKPFYKRYLRDHMFVHTGETPYKCEFCDRKFAARNNLAVHRRKRHSENLGKIG